MSTLNFPIEKMEDDSKGWTEVTRRDKRSREEKRRHKYNLQLLSDKILSELHNRMVYLRMNRKLTGVEIHLRHSPLQDSRQILPVTFDIEHFKITPLKDRQYFTDDRDRSQTPHLDVDLSFWLKRMTERVVWMRIARDQDYYGLEMFKDIPGYDIEDREVGVVRFVIAGVILIKDDTGEQVYVNN